MKLPSTAQRRARMLLLACAGLAAAPAPAQPSYDSLEPAKALAVSLERPDEVRGLVHDQPNDLVAAVRARELCLARASENDTCELVRLNDRRITTGAEILARVPDEPHPLFLWRYQRGSTVVYLAGSIHILKPSLYPLPRQFESAFRHADYLVLEVDVGSLNPEHLQRRTLAYALLPEEQTLSDVLPADLYRRLDRHLAAFGMSSAALEQAKPAMAMTQIVVSRLLSLGYLPESGLENHFSSLRSGQQVLELESLDEQLQLMFDQPMATQIQLLAETLDVEDDVEPLLAKMLLAWLSGDDATFLDAFKAQSGNSPESVAFSRALLDDRNRKMATRIRRYLESGQGGQEEEPQTYFVLVGAAHLVGEAGIVELLAREGFEGQRVLSSQSIATLEEAL